MLGPGERGVRVTRPGGEGGGPTSVGSILGSKKFFFTPKIEQNLASGRAPTRPDPPPGARPGPTLPPVAKFKKKFSVEDDDCWRSDNALFLWCSRSWLPSWDSALVALQTRLAQT